MVGTAIGIGAPTSMTEPRSVRPRTANAASIRSRSHGASSPGPAIQPRRARHGGGRQISRPPRRRPGPALHPPSTRRRSIPAISKATRRHPRERRPIYAWRALVGDCIRHAGRRRQGRRVVLDLNPINHASTPDAIHRYKVEPYVACADLYSTPPHVGRGGWTWYTGSAGWMYRAGLEWILGFRLQGDACCCPLHPKDMAGFWNRFPISLLPLRNKGRKPGGRVPRHGQGGA